MTEIVADARVITTKSSEQIFIWHLVESKVLTEHGRGYKKFKFEDNKKTINSQTKEKEG